MSNTIKRETARLSDRLHTWWDRLKVQAQLAEMDAEDTWGEVARYAERTLKHVDDAAEKLHGTKDEANLQIQLGLMEAKERAEDLEVRLTDLWRRMQAAGEDVQGRAELAKLRVHLAAMDATDAFESKRDEFRRQLEGSRAEAERALEQGMKRISDRLDQLLGREDDET